MSLLTFGGLASGLDTNAIIDAIMGAERVPLQHLQTKKANVDAAQSTVSSITSRLSSLKSAALALSTTAGYVALKASSSDASVVATASGGAAAGSFDVTVQQLAKEHRSYSNAQTSSTTALGMTGPVSIKIGSGTPAVLDIAATDSLSDIAVKINSAGLRVSASVVFDGTNYKMQVRGMDTGAANAVTFGETTTSLGLSASANQFQSAQDAKLVVDGMNVTRSTNQVAGVIPGVTLALTKTTTSPTTITIDSDSSGLSQKITAFVTAYNDSVSATQSAAGWGSFKASNTVLAGDSALRGVLDRISRSVGGAVPQTSGKYTTLGSIGINSNRDGKLVFDEAKLKTALLADPSGVQKLFVNDAALGSTGAMKGIMAVVDSIATNGNSLLKAKTDSLGAQSRRMDDDAAAMQRRLDLTENQLRQRFTALEEQMSKIKTFGSGLAGLTTMTGS